MNVYEVKYTGEKDKGVYALSVVSDPAMQDMWIALKEHPETIELAEVDSEKRLLLGAALIPDKKIRRIDENGNEFFITFKSETIENLAHDFIKNGMQKNSSLEHEVQLDGMSVVQSWIVDDPDNDKSKAYGKTYEKGTWVAMMKVENDEIWSKVKSGEIKGFSIDALIALEKIELNNNKMSKENQNMLDKLMTFLSSDAPAPEVQEPVEESIVEASPEAETVEKSTEAMKSEIANVLAQFKNETENSINDLKQDFDAKLSAKNDELEAKSKEIEELKAELAKTPEVEATKVAPTEKKEVKQLLNNQQRMTSSTRAKAMIADAMGW